MVKKIIKAFQKFFSHRLRVLVSIFLVMSLILAGRLYKLQIIDGNTYSENFIMRTTKTRTLKSTRGNIYDCYGRVIAYNKLTNAVTIEDNGTYSTTREKNLTLNGEIYKLVQMIREKGDTLNNDFHITLDGNGDFVFDTENETTIDRFRADVFGYRTIDELNEDEAAATAGDIMNELGGAYRYGLFNEDRPYSEEELTEHGLPLELSNQDMLDIITVRYQLSLISYQRYMSVTVASDVSDETVAAVEENKEELPGVDISEDYIRVYNNPYSMSSIIGYTGSPSAEELDTLMAESDKYSSSSIIGKAGIEQYMETTLQGTDGSEQVVVDNLGRVLEEDEASLVEPVQGNNVYLTIDSELQEVAYHILEQRLAGIILTNLVDAKTVVKDTENNDTVSIPSYDVYNAFIGNNILDMYHFDEEDASDTEKNLYNALLAREDEIQNWYMTELTTQGAAAYKDLGDEQKAYFDYIIADYLVDQTGIINTAVVNRKDPMWTGYFTDGTVSPRDFLYYAANSDWIDLTQLEGMDSDYLTTDEIFNAILNYLTENLAGEEAYDKLLYKYMLLDDVISPQQLCIALYDQGVISTEDGMYDRVASGEIPPYEFITYKITSLELTPGMLALDPCAGSIVVTDPSTGAVRACVSYPGYDINRLANTMDTAYYNKLLNDASTPFYNKATQQVTAPGSTFKPIMVAAGLTENVINDDSIIDCRGVFGEGFLSESDQVKCWYTSGHGNLDVSGGLANSCNVFFCTVGWLLGKDADDTFVQDQALSKIQQYAADFGLDSKTGIQISETEPHISDDLAIPASIGQGTHQFATAQLARYAAVLANRGTVYDLSLLDHVADPDGNVLETFAPKAEKQTAFADNVWSDIYAGMEGAVSNDTVWTRWDGWNQGITLYGKTGTAQESELRPDHGLWIAFTHKDGTEGTTQQDIALSIRIPFGYASRNACLVGRDLLNYYYGMIDEGSLINGQAATGDVTRVTVED